MPTKRCLLGIVTATAYITIDIIMKNASFLPFMKPKTKLAKCMQCRLMTVAHWA